MPSLLLCLLIACPCAAADQRDEMMAQMTALLADCRPLVSQLEDLHKRYAAAETAEELGRERADVRARLEPMLGEIDQRRKSFQQSNRILLYAGVADTFESMKRRARSGKDKTVGSFMIYQGEEKRVRSFLESTEALLFQDDADFKALLARLQMEREQARMRMLWKTAAAAAAVGLCVWGALGLRS
jgi:chromatin segregation and condensation protein Rec8/ScpA/Scc1 (kleisin family)